MEKIGLVLIRRERMVERGKAGGRKCDNVGGRKKGKEKR